MRGFAQFRSWLAERVRKYTKTPGDPDTSDDESEPESEGEEGAPDGQQPANEHAGGGSDDGGRSASAASGGEQEADPDGWFVYEQLPCIAVPELVALAIATFHAQDVAAVAVGMEAVSWLLVLQPDDHW